MPRTVIPQPSDPDPTTGQLEEGVFASSQVTLLAVIFAVCAFCGVLFFRRKRTFVDVRLEGAFFTALRSSVIYLLMALPLLSPHTRALFFPNFWSSYHWLPFWYCFVIQQRFGETVFACWNAAFGSCLGVAGSVLLNYLMPGGAGPLSRDEEFTRHAWLPGGYHYSKAVLYTVALSYWIFLTRWYLDTQRYAVSTFACIAVAFMNPDQDEKAFEAILLDWDHNMNWSGPSLCSLYPILLAVPMAFLTLPVFPPARKSTEILTCQEQAKADLRLLVADTQQALERLLTYWLTRNEALIFDLTAVCHYVQELELRCDEIDVLVEKAEWEWFGESHLRRLEMLRQATGLLKTLHQALRVQLDQMQWHSVAEGLQMAAAVDLDLKGSISDQNRDHLDAFKDAFKELLHVTVLEPTAQAGQGAHGPAGDDAAARRWEQARELLASADASVKEALRELQQDSEEGERLSGEQVFLDGLRSLPAVFQSYLNDMRERNAEVKPVQSWPSCMCNSMCETFVAPLNSWSDHKLAMRYTTAFTLSFLWSVYVRGYRSSCVSSVCFLYSMSIGSLAERNVNRMLGVALGIYIGNMPDAILLDRYTGFHGVAFRKFHSEWVGLLVYLISMLIVWVVSLYGALAAGSRWSYACLLCGGFSSAQLIGRLKLLQPTPDSSSNEYALFMDVMDHFAACLILCVVDYSFAFFSPRGLTPGKLSGDIPAMQLEVALPDCLRQIPGLLVKIRTFDASVGDATRSLGEAVKAARMLHMEVVKEDSVRVWSAPLRMPYKAHFVGSMLEHCERVMVASRAMLLSSQRCPDTDIAASLVRDFLPHTVTKRTETYAETTHRVLRGEISRKEDEPPDEDDAGGMPTGLRARRMKAHTLSFASMSADRSSAHHRTRYGSRTPMGRQSSLGAMGRVSSLEEMVDQFNVNAPLQNIRGKRRTASNNESIDSIDETDAWSPARRKWTDTDAAAEAASLALRIATVELRLALQRMETLLREQRFWDFCSRQHDQELADVRPRSNPTNGWAKSIREASCGERYECEFLVADCSTPPEARLPPPEEVESRRLTRSDSEGFPSVSPL